MAWELIVEMPDATKAADIADFVYVHKNTETWDDDADPDTPEAAKYTDNQWVKEHLRRYVQSQIIRGKNATYRDAQVGVGVTDVN